jgi:hypothetical protein
VVARHPVIRAERSVSQSKRVLLLFTLFLFGCSSASPSPTPAPVIETPPLPAAATPTPAPDFVTRIRNAKYQLGFTDSLQVVQLTDGKFEQGAPGGVDYISVNVADFAATGDLNGDGEDEIAALVVENYGGSGTFVFLVVYAEENRKLTFQTSAFVDDRPILKALSIEGGEILLDAVIHTTEDPLCCPTLRMNRHFRLLPDNQLDATDYATFTPDGRERTITIESPLDGAGTFSSFRIKGNVAIAPFENNLTYRIYDVGGVELAAGAIKVSAPEPGAPGTFDAVISLGRVLSGVVIRVEVQDVNSADGSLFAMDSIELVVK